MARPAASHTGPANRAAGCVTIATIQIAIAIGMPISGAAIGARNGRGRSGSIMRRRITASCAAAKASSTPKE